MQDKSPLMVIACYAMLVGASLPIVQWLRRENESFAIGLGVLLILMLLYAIARARKALPTPIDDRFESFAPYALLIAIFGIVSTLALQCIGWWN